MSVRTSSRLNAPLELSVVDRVLADVRVGEAASVVAHQLVLVNDFALVERRQFAM